MLPERERQNQGNFVDASLLLDSVTSLIDAFKWAGYNSPTSIQVDKRAFDKLLEEASKLYSSINVKVSIANQEFSIANIINILLEGGKEKAVNRFQERKNDNQQPIKSTGDTQENQQPRLSTTTTKYECPDCGALFDTPAGHRKHYQAFHGGLKNQKL